MRSDPTFHIVVVWGKFFSCFLEFTWKKKRHLRDLGAVICTVGIRSAQVNCNCVDLRSRHKHNLVLVFGIVEVEASWPSLYNTRRHITYANKGLVFSHFCHDMLVFPCTTWAQVMLVAVLTHLMSLPIFQQLMAVSNKTALRGEAKPAWRGKSCWNMPDAKKLLKFFLHQFHL